MLDTPCISYSSPEVILLKLSNLIAVMILASCQLSRLESQRDDCLAAIFEKMITSYKTSNFVMSLGER